METRVGSALPQNRCALQEIATFLHGRIQFRVAQNASSAPVTRDRGARTGMLRNLNATRTQLWCLQNSRNEVQTVGFMTSCEAHRSSAYSEDLRWRMVWQCEALRYTHARVAENLGVDRLTVSRTFQIFHVSGSVTKKVYPKSEAFRKLTTRAKLLILNLVVKKPGICDRIWENEPCRAKNQNWFYFSCRKP